MTNPFFLLNRLLFFFPVLMNGNKDYNSGEKHYAAQNNIVSHYSSLLSIVANIKRITHNIKPNSSLVKFTPSIATNCPRTIIARTRFPVLYRALPNPFFWFFVNLIKDSLSKAKLPVKQIVFSVPPLEKDFASLQKRNFPLWERGIRGGFLGQGRFIGSQRCCIRRGVRGILGQGGFFGKD